MGRSKENQNETAEIEHPPSDTDFSWGVCKSKNKHIKKFSEKIHNNHQSTHSPHTNAHSVAGHLPHPIWLCVERLHSRNGRTGGTYWIQTPSANNNVFIFCLIAQRRTQHTTRVQRKKTQHMDVRRCAHTQTQMKGTVKNTIYGWG